MSGSRVGKTIVSCLVAMSLASTSASAGDYSISITQPAAGNTFEVSAECAVLGLTD